MFVAVKSYRSRGIGLVSMLVVSLLIFVLALAVSGAGLFHLNLSARQAHETVAQDLAEAAVSRVLERVLEQESRTGELDFGEDRLATERVEIPGSTPGSFGLVTFDPNYSDPSGARVPASVNNLRSDSSTAADNGTVIPRESIYVVGYGISGEVERRVEAVVYLPRFPFSIASQGSFRGSDVLVAGLDDDAVVRPGVPVPRELLKSGHLVSNSTIPNAVQLGGRSWVKGNVQSVSGAQLGPETRVDGELLLYSAPAEIPRIDVTRYRPTSGPVFAGLLALERHLELGRTAIFSGSMVIIDGLYLDGGFLYVNGDLEIRGGVHGKGAIVATGNLTINGGGSVSSDNVAAFLAGGDISIQGTTSSPEDSIVEGLIYAGGRAVVKDVTLIGTLLSAGTGESTLDNSVVLEREQHGTVEITGIDSTTRRDPTTWDHIGLELSETAPPSSDNAISYRISSLDNIDDLDIDARLARSFNEIEGRLKAQTQEHLESLTTEREGNPDNPLSGGIEPWYGLLIVRPVNETQVRTVVTRGTGHTNITDVVQSRTVLSINLSEFISPLSRMRVKWWRNL